MILFSGGHPGITRTLKKIKLHYHWKGMTRDIARYVKQCKNCQTNKTTKKGKEPFILTPTPLKAFDIVIIDTIGPLPRSEQGNEYAVTMICDLTKYLVTVPIPNKSAMNVAKAILDGFVLTYGPMKKVLTDMGTEYMNEVFSELCSLLNVEKLNSTPYHHETLGTVERSHRTFNEYLRTYISSDKSDWDTWLKYFTYCYNTTPSTTHGYCPFELIYGKVPGTLDFNTNTIDPLYNVDSYAKEVKFRLQVAQRRAANIIENTKIIRQQSSKDKSFPTDIVPNDLVLISNEAGHKFDPVYKGPYKVIKVYDNNNVELMDQNKKRILVHKNRVKIYNR